MKKVLMISAMSALVLGACGEEKHHLGKGNGKIRVEKRVFVENPLPLKGKIILKFKIQESQGGEQSSGTYKHIESND
ncbi:hypothetical protein KEH51_01515 [[Brevibacterium] frigoritolerans]|uniref:Lipoprotein n=1 Tax=Peribacillus frigoritolerans TaxID=450367 RepID=A0A941J4F9_9BACI|nr:hypothetical protein [Peribacillus frigoritolerans]